MVEDVGNRRLEGGVVMSIPGLNVQRVRSTSARHLMLVLFALSSVNIEAYSAANSDHVN